MSRSITRWHEVTEGLKNRRMIVSKDFYTPPLPCPAALRGFAYKIGTETKREYVSTSPPVFCAAKYRGSARRARGLNTIVEQKYETPPPVVSRNITGYRLAIGGKNKHVTQESIILLPCVLQRKI